MKSSMMFIALAATAALCLGARALGDEAYVQYFPLAYRQATLTPTITPDADGHRHPHKHPGSAHRAPCSQRDADIDADSLCYRRTDRHGDPRSHGHPHQPAHGNVHRHAGSDSDPHAHGDAHPPHLRRLPLRLVEPHQSPTNANCVVAFLTQSIDRAGRPTAPHRTPAQHNDGPACRPGADPAIASG
jgi:hypothetical protein